MISRNRSGPTGQPECQLAPRSAADTFLVDTVKAGGDVVRDGVEETCRGVGVEVGGVTDGEVTPGDEELEGEVCGAGEVDDPADGAPETAKVAELAAIDRPDAADPVF